MQRSTAGFPSGSGQEPLRRAVRNSALNVTAFALNATFNLLALCVLARTLGKEDLGQYYTVYAILTLVQLVSEAGIPTILTCRVIQSPATWKATVAEAGGLCAIVIAASSAALVGMGVAWSWRQGGPGALSLFSVAALACAAIHLQRFSAGVFQAFELFAYESVAKVVQGALFATGVTVLPLLGQRADPRLALMMFAASHVAAALFTVGSLHRRLRCVGLRLNRALARDWLSEAGPLGVGDVLRRLTGQVDTLLLGLLQAPAVVGIYSVAYRPLASLIWLPHVILSATLPSFARMAEGDRTALQRAFRTSIRLMWIVSLPIAVSICVCAEPVVILLAGPAYLEAAVPLRILIWITSLLFLSVPFRFFLAALGESRIYLRLVIVVLLLEAVTEATLIPWWGYLGACAGSVLGELFFTARGLAIFRRLGMGKIEWRAIGCASLAGGAMGVLLWFARTLPLPALAPTMVLATGLYFLACLFLGALRWDELRRLIRLAMPAKSAADAETSVPDHGHQQVERAAASLAGTTVSQQTS